MKFEEYQTLARRTQNKDLDNTQREYHAMHGMASEVGEIHGLYQKVFQGHVATKEAAVKELGDLLWFMAEYTDALGVDLEAVARMNIDKLRKRYPDGFDVDHSVHREEYGG